ncbi:hypothetical protein VNO80_05133 [Phaseolus coccineus]|uniref:Peptidase M16 N-terminal domain-containing protein n=1 Tax=Phaseolus coccineus TaxID=3886 RepID=A0AAN9NLD0_PHACN
MCVGMGSFSDPNEAQNTWSSWGVMNFQMKTRSVWLCDVLLIHVYSYLSKHGGSSNAYTETEYTCYHFEVKREFLKGALKRFSQFFISPLVKMEAMEQEVLAPDSDQVWVMQSGFFEKETMLLLLILCRGKWVTLSKQLIFGFLGEIWFERFKCGSRCLHVVFLDLLDSNV